MSDLGLENTVTFLGKVAHDAVPALMDTFDVLVNPTVVPEAFGVVVLEGSASGLAVVASNVGGVPEVCIDGTTGIMIPPRDPRALADAVNRLASDPSLRRSMGVAGRALVDEHFEWSTSVTAMLRVLESARERR